MREDYYSFLYRVFGLVTELEELKLYVPGYWFGLMHCVEIWFDDVSINEKGIGIILGICINLESLYLRNCFELRRLEISNLTPKLQNVDVVVQVDLNIIEIKLSSLLDFSYWCDSCYDVQTCDIDVSGCKNLKRLSLNTVQFYHHPELSSYLEYFPALEHLCLTKCQSVNYVEISSKCLVYLSINNCRDLVKFKIRTPNLKSFSYWGEDVISLVSKGPALKLEYADINLRAGFRNEKWYLGLIRLIAKLSHSEKLFTQSCNYSGGVLLFVPMKDDAVIPEDVRLKVRPPLHGVKHLIAEIRVSTRHDYDFVSVNVDLVDGLLWLAPCLESLRVSNFDDKIVKLFKFMYEKPVKGKKKCGCWKSLAINCWRHSLTNVSLEYELGDEDDTQLAEFFHNARLDGKMVILSRLPRLKWNME